MIHLAKRDRINPAASWGIRLAAFVLGLLVCGVLAFIMIEKLQKDPGRIGEFYQSFLKGVYSDNAANFLANRKFWVFLKNIAVLLCIALAVTPAFRMRFWNIGAEGQTLVGVLAATAVSVYIGGTGKGAVSLLPEWALLILMFIAAIIASSIWGLIPALFKARWNTNETLFTLMMNYVATYLVSFFLIEWVPSGSSALGELPYGYLPNIPIYADNPNAPSNKYILIIVLVFLLAGILYIYLKRSKHGYELTVVGESERTARYVGISVKKVTIRTMVLSGALCGFAGYLIAAGLDHSVTTESVGGQGFTAIMVSWLANFNPLAMILTAAVIVFLNQGASQISTTFGVSGAFPSVVVGVMLFFIIGSEFFIHYKLCFSRSGAAAQEHKMPEAAEKDETSQAPETEGKENAQ